MARRLVIGQQADGSFGIRCSAPGFDALFAADDGRSITFDSRWADIAKIHAVGIVPWSAAAWQQVDSLGNVLTFPGFAAVWPALPYKPFIEVRAFTGGNVVRDDWWSAAAPMGNPAAILTNAFRMGGNSSYAGYSAIYVVYRIPVPSG
ncbi:hypothetical protein [Bradyrhizobium sp. Ai1a-2]|uniref:hypothetical protein n=1 Tax=Bradyrhizobium sp. Ai1a-2 TaxID=196490 RepID=UPI00047F589E|nr:hypothetical protein [Bradyrhizobium sp. Ai1a-2]